MRIGSIGLICGVLAAALAANSALAQGGGGAGGGPGGGGGGGGFRLAPLLMQSMAFEDGGVVPAKYSFRGGNTQPGFTFSNAPAETVSYAIIFHDIDVALRGTTDDVTHWVVWNIPASAGGIPEGSLPAGAVQGKNMANQNSYFGPGAPPGPRYHHYVFELFALSANLDLPETAGRAELVAAMNGKIVAKAAYVGRFKGSE
jgi:Raf kinase inhibitor-like YbhB/YbcL family protein